jgi:hypothetical protein
MAMKRLPRLGRRRAEQLLDGRLSDGAGDGELARLLDLARRPADPARPAPGEQAAVLAYLAAGAPDVPPTRSEPVRTLGIRKLLAVKVLAVGAAVATVGGVAVAATDNGAEDRVEIVASRPTSQQPAATSARPAPAPGSTSAAGRATTSRTPAPAARASTPAHPRSSAAPSQLPLAVACVIWERRSQTPPLPAQAVRELRAHHLKVPSLPTPALVAALVRAAGGAAKVQAYCARIVDRVCATLPRPSAGTSGQGRSPAGLPQILCPLRAGRTAGAPTPSSHPVVPAPVVSAPPHPVPAPSPWPTQRPPARP